MCDREEVPLLGQRTMIIGCLLLCVVLLLASAAERPDNEEAN